VKGQTTGVLTYAEVAMALSEVELDEGDIEELHGYFEKSEIELVEEVDPALEAAQVERAPDKRGRRKKATLDLKPDMTTDSLQLFLKDIGTVRLLTAQEEVDLAKRIERGDLDAKQKMVESNLRLVVSIAKNYRNQGLPFLDLIQEGTLGLVRAAEKFDYRKGFKFSTYATWWIRQAIARALADKARTIRIPVHVVEKLNKIGRAERKLVTELGREPTPEEIAEHTGIEPEEVELAKRIERGEHRAKQEMVEANLRLVVSIAKRYRNQGLPFLDLIQEGTIGLVRAAEKFDHRKGFKFSTYATWWIRQAVARALADKARTIRMPVHIVEKLNKIVRSERKLRAELGREPTSGEIAKDVELTTDEVEQIRRSSQAPVSLEKPVGDEEESEFGHFLTDENEPLPDEVAEVEMRKATLQRVLDTLSARERRVLELRYGLNGEHPRTLDEVGKTFNVTRERIRQIENQSLKKLRALGDSTALRDVA
ncbi:MAG: sigma-70 family RNA polymerase sigma factor, partial [Gaiellaceae bacterium]